MNRKKPSGRVEPAWLGLDSRHGRYLFGAGEGPKEGIMAPLQLLEIRTGAHLPFTGTRLFVHHHIAPDFLIHRIFVGNSACGMVNQDPIIAEPFAVDFTKLLKLGTKERAQVFSELFDGKRAMVINIDRPASELGGPLPLPTIQPGMVLSFQVENIGKDHLRFLASLLGTIEV